MNHKYNHDQQKQKAPASQHMYHKLKRCKYLPAITSYETAVRQMTAGEIVDMDMIETAAADRLFYANEIDEALKQRISGISYTENPNIALTQLRYLRLLYYGFDGSSKLSNHSFGMAVDLNPKYNPYVRTKADKTVVYQPQSGSSYADRNADFEHKITAADPAYQLFTEAGFTWGGDWSSVKDYQHFEKAE